MEQRYSFRSAFFFVAFVTVLFYFTLVSNFKVVICVITQRILAYTRGLSVKLQGRYIDAVRAHTDIESVKSVLKGCRSQVDDFHQQLYEEVVR